MKLELGKLFGKPKVKKKRKNSRYVDADGCRVAASEDATGLPIWGFAHDVGASKICSAEAALAEIIHKKKSDIIAADEIAFEIDT